MGRVRDEITPEEWASLTAAQRALFMEVDAMPDIHDEGDDRFDDDFPYDNVYGVNGELLT